MRTTRDNGKTWAEERNEVLAGFFFFKSEQKLEHTRTVYNIINVLSQLGGLMKILMSGFELVCIYVNR